MECKNKDCNGTMRKKEGITHTKWESYYTYECNRCKKQKIELLREKINNKEVK
jgi:hypothetical protein